MSEYEQVFFCPDPKRKCAECPINGDCESREMMGDG
jgi:hypothetical protein